MLRCGLLARISPGQSVGALRESFAPSNGYCTSSRPSLLAFMHRTALMGDTSSKVGNNLDRGRLASAGSFVKFGTLS